MCPGGIMARNPLWRKTARQWRDQMGIWSNRRAGAALLFAAVFFVLLAFLSLFFFFDFVDELPSLGRVSPIDPQRVYGLPSALLYVALLMPSRIYELMPIAVLIGCVFVMARLAQSSIQPTRQPVRQLGQALLAIHDMDELQEKKRQVERSMLADAWSMAMCQQAYDALDRRAMQIYDLHHPATDVHKDEHPPVTPKQHFEHALRHARPIRLFCRRIHTKMISRVSARNK